MIVVCSGLIGVGKSSLCNSLCDQLNASPFYEPVESNVYLEDYYRDPASYAWRMQVNLLNDRFVAYQEAQWRSRRGELCICDRSIYEDYAFAQVQRVEGYLDEKDFLTYNRLHTTYTSFLTFPELLIYLKCPVETAMTRIAKRSRNCECGIAYEYMRHLQDAYDQIMPVLSRKCPIVEIDATKSKEDVLIDAIEAIEARRKEISGIQPVYHGGF